MFRLNYSVVYYAFFTTVSSAYLYPFKNIHLRMCFKTNDPLEAVNNKIFLECSETYMRQAGRQNI
jgi:hypothetical protein